MNMQMRYTFTPVLSIIDYDSKSIIQILRSGKFSRYKKEFAEDVLIFFWGESYPGYEFFGNYKDMSWCLWGHVTNRDTTWILENNFSRNLSLDNLLKNRAHLQMPVNKNTTMIYLDDQIRSEER